jgi:hypothetical protein
MSQRTGNTGESSTKQIVDFNEARAQRMDEKRRKTERIFFKNLLSVYCVTETAKMRPIEILDVSENGCSFQVPFDGDHPWPTDAERELPIRFYFSQDTYLLVHFKVENARPCISQGARYTRFGCSVDTGLSSYLAYQQFVRFLKMYSEHAHKDAGDVSVFYI